jgi:hypothetical protein
LSGETILSLCDHSGRWCRPYRDAGYDVVQVDLEHGQDVRLLRRLPGRVRGILAAPPCDHFSRAGAHLWSSKGEAALLEGLSVVDACLRAVAIYRPAWWALENPIGRLQDYLGPPTWKFDPYEFGALSDEEDRDAYTKRTWLWGQFTVPAAVLIGCDARVAPASFGTGPGCRDWTTRKSSRHKAARSATPTGFARAFFRCNP